MTSEPEVPGSLAEALKNDPLLLRADTQKAFGRQLLRNVLVRRTVLSGQPQVVDLFSPKAAPPRKTGASRPVPEAVVAKYLAGRIAREETLTTSERDELRRVTMVCDASRTGDRLRNVVDMTGKVIRPRIPTHDEARAALAASQIDIEKRLRVAAVGFRVKISRQADRVEAQEDLCFMERLASDADLAAIPDGEGLSELGRTRKVEAESPDRWRRWIDTVCDHIGSAVRSGSQVVVLPEFGLPPEIDTDTMNDRILRRLEEDGSLERAPFLVFAGSRHEGAVNRGLIRYHRPGENPHPPEWHKKVSSARSLGENVLGPPNDIYVTYRTTLKVGEQPYPLHATVAICYDTFDPSTFLSLVLHAAMHEVSDIPQIILVPSFNPSDEFVRLLRDLSFLTASIVVYVNSLHGDADAFIAGFRAADLAKSTGAGLIGQIDQQMASLKQLLATTLQEIDYANESGDSRLADEQHAISSLAKEQMPLLESLRQRTLDLNAQRAFDGLMSVEPCGGCARANHVDDYGCNSDILYFNFDPELIQVLIDWRRVFFKRDESFLPEPFRSASLGEEANNLRNRQRRRRARG